MSYSSSTDTKAAFSNPSTVKKKKNGKKGTPTYGQYVGTPSWRPILSALRKAKAGDFSARADVAGDGPEADVAELLNEVLSLNFRMLEEFRALRLAVGQEGRVSQRAKLSGASGGWVDAIGHVNDLVADLAYPSTEVSRVVGAVVKGDLSQLIEIEREGKALKGEFRRLGQVVNTMVERMRELTSEVTRVAREVGSEGKLGGQAEVKGVAGTWKDLTDSVNTMASNLTNQVRNIAEVTTAVEQRLFFEAFQQADGTTSRKYGGTGLGLSISREIARLTGGENSVDSLVDVVMLGMDGFEVVRAVRNREKTARVPIIFTSGFQIDETDVTIVYDLGAIDYLTLPLVLGDEAQLTQMVQNLIGNSIKFCPHRTPEIEIKVVAEEEMIKFSVKDNGIGIAPRHFGKVFSAFERLHDKTRYPGTGVGLAICKKIIEHHGGKIWLESEEGVGTTFFFTLPNGKNEQTVVSARAPLTGMRLLIVDDDQDIALLLRAYLANLGADVQMTNSGKDCLKVVKESNFHTIVLDIQMPEMDGFETLKKLREMECEIPAVAYTSIDFHFRDKDFKKAGFVKVVSKNGGPARLVDYLKNSYSKFETSFLLM